LPKRCHKTLFADFVVVVFFEEIFSQWVVHLCCLPMMQAFSLNGKDVE
jgi:hypothetical protein